MKKFDTHKFMNFAAVCVILLAIFINLAGCGVINPSGSDGAESLTFASKENYERKDIIVDAVENIPTGNTSVTSPTSSTSPTSPITPTSPVVDDTPTNPVSQEQNLEVSENSEISDIPKDSEIPVTTERGNIFAPPIIDKPTEAPVQSNDGTVRMSFIAAGDNIMHSNMIDDAKERAKDGENFNFRIMYKDIEDIITKADIAFVNVETPIAGDEFAYAGYPMFNTPKENGFALVDIGFDIVNIANNHMLDKWEKGYINNINFWESQNVLLIGGFKDAQDFENIRIYEKNGVTIAFLSYTYGTNGMYLPADSKMIVPLIDSATIERQVKAAKPLADLLFVVMHWGQEDNFTPDQTQRNLAQMMVDNGVDVIIGMHPHVLQETKWVTRPDGKQTLITYSIGNMISGMLGAKNMVGGFLGFDIVKTTVGGVSDTKIENAEIIPIVTHYNMPRKVFQIYKFEDYTEELAKGHGCINSDTKFSYKYLKDLIIQNVAPEFLSDFYKE